MTSVKDKIRRTGRSPIFQVSWSKNELAELRREGAQKIRLAARERLAQFDLHLSWTKFFDLVTDKVILSRLTDVFDDDSFQLVETRLYPKRPESFVKWHIDVKQLEYYQPSLLNSKSDDFHSITIWLALGDVPVEMGPLQFVHYKHVDLQKLVRTWRHQPDRRYREECAAEAAYLSDYVEILPMKAGEFCMFDPRNLHTGAPNHTDQFRLGLVVRYCARHVKVDSRFSKSGLLRIIQIKNGRAIRPPGI